MPHNTAPLFKTVKIILKNLAENGWHKYLKDLCGLDISLEDDKKLAIELTKKLDLSKLKIDPNYVDLPLDTERAIERGDPAKSLLYHVLMSPTVAPETIKSYPTLADIEIIENYIFVATLNEYINKRGPISPPTYEEIQQKGKELNNNQDCSLAVVVFAQEYRQGDASVHHKHADLCFSRTGVARVGNAPAFYDAKIRGFSPINSEKPYEIRTLPARYNAYIAVLLSPTKDNNTFGPLGLTESTGDKNDLSRKFWVPLHKIFSGRECLSKVDLLIKYQAFHVNEKIKRFHTFLASHKIDAGYLNEANSNGLNKEPFLITEGIAELANDSASCHGLVIPRPQSLVKKSKVLFQVPTPRTNSEMTIAVKKDSSLQISAVLENRPAPEFTHIRHQLESTTSGGAKENYFKEINLNEIDLNENARMLKDDLLIAENRHAFHYTDGIADGWVTVQLEGLSLQILPAFSLVTTPDFYPQVNQYSIYLWYKRKTEENTSTTTILKPDKADPLSQERHCYPNLDLMHNNKSVFNVSSEDTDEYKYERTFTAIITLPGSRGNLVNQRNSVYAQVFGFDESRKETLLKSFLRHQSLPDAASGVYQPGWDVSYNSKKDNKNNNIFYFATYGLGSPFTEDTKICAAMNTYWPAASPDSSRTYVTDALDNEFVNRDTFIAVPMTNSEIGATLPINTNVRIPWDGVAGPKITQVGREFNVTFPNYSFVDYTLNAAANTFSLYETAKLSTKDYLQRVKLWDMVKKYMKGDMVLRGIFRGGYLLSFEKDDKGNNYFYFGEIANKEVSKSNHRFFEANIPTSCTITVTADQDISHVMGLNSKFTTIPPSPM